jgi:hypothetical protein
MRPCHLLHAMAMVHGQCLVFYCYLSFHAIVFLWGFRVGVMNYEKLRKITDNSELRPKLRPNLKIEIKNDVIFRNIYSCLQLREIPRNSDDYENITIFQHSNFYSNSQPSIKLDGGQL